MTTGPRVGSSSVAWDTPGGVMTSIAFGTVPGSAEQIGLSPPAAHTPNSYGWGVAAKARAWSGLNPSWPVRTTAKDQPGAGLPKAACGSPIVMVLLACDAATNAVPTELPEASCQTGAAKPCTSTRSLHASAGAMV